MSATLARAAVATLDERFNVWPPELATLASIGRRLCKDGAWLESPGEALLIGTRPQIALNEYAMTLYPALDVNDIVQYQSVMNLVIPEDLRSILLGSNGFRLFEFSMFGIPRSMLSDKPLLDRSSRNPLDISTANQFWKLEYKPLIGQFYFGIRNYGWEKQIGYFLNTDRSVVAYWSQALSEDQRVAGRWESLASFMAEELEAIVEQAPEQDAEIAARTAEAYRPNLLTRLLGLFGAAGGRRR